MGQPHFELQIQMTVFSGILFLFFFFFIWVQLGFRTPPANVGGQREGLLSAMSLACKADYVV